MNKKDLEAKCEAIQDEIIKYRREIHSNPELQYKEKDTSNYIQKKLKKMGIDVEKGFIKAKDIKKDLQKNNKSNGTVNIEDIKDYSVLGTLKGSNKKGRGGKTVMLRADMDALSITETKDSNHLPNIESFRSENDGVMHACGHDAHTAMLLGAARVLSKMKDDIKGEVKFLFQSAEEVGAARLLSKSDLLNGVDAIFGIHIWSDIESGKVKINHGPVMSSDDIIKIEVKGGGGHGSKPYETRDPLLISTYILNSIYKMVNREIDPREPAVLSITKINSGNTCNIIPDSAVMEGTLRTFDENISKKILKRFREIGTKIADLYDLEFELIIPRSGAPTTNHKKEAGIANNVAKELFGKEKIISGKPEMASEDFGFYLKRVPGAFLLLGTKNETKGINKPHHHPKFDIDESVLHKGTALHVGTALRYLKED